MFSKVSPKRLDGITQNNVGDLKLPEFYSKSTQDKIDQWKELSVHHILSCHRQFGFDFNTIEPVTVVSIKINNRQWLYNRVIKKHWKQLNYNVGNSNLKKIKNKLPRKYWPKFIETQ